MIHVAVVAREKNWFDQIITRIPRLPVSFRWFENIEAFLVNQELEDWQLIYLIADQFALLQEELVLLNEKEVKVPVICTTPKLTLEQKRLLTQLNVKEILRWPVTRQEMEYFFMAFPTFLAAAEQDETYLFVGHLDYLDGVELLRALCKEENSGIVSFNWGERNGRIEIHNGQIIHAAYRQLDPLTSILVLTSWQHGQAAFKAETFLSKRSIMLTNEQIFDECLQYRQERHLLMESFPSKDVKLFTHPDLNFEDFGPSERTWLYKMYKGKTLSEIRDLYEGDFNFLLKKLKLWLEKQYIIPEEEYHLIKAQKEADRAASGFKRLMRKIIKSGKAEEEKQKAQPEKTPAQEKLPYSFTDFETLQAVKSLLEEV